ncbi:MAG: Ig-like domain-containing protein [Promethearchaeota archaeon]
MKTILNIKSISLSLVLLIILVSLTSGNTLGNTTTDVQQTVSGPPNLSASPVIERPARSFCSNPFSRGEEKDSDTESSVKGSERNCALNSWTDCLSTLKRDQEPLVAGEQILKFDLGDYFQLTFGYPTPLLLRFTYTNYIDSTHVNVTLESAGSPEWISVNTLTRLVEDGMWTDIYYPYHIETDIDVGDTINWFMGTGYVDDTAWYDWGGTLLEVWIILLDDYSPGSYAYFHKETGIMLYYWDSLHDMEVFIADTNMITLAPTVTITYPNGGERLSGTVNIYWTASVVNPVGDYYNFTVYYWDDSNWAELASDLQNIFRYTWDTTTVTDGAFYKIRVVASDGELTGEDESDATFIINNINEPLTVTVAHPNGGETFHDDFLTINWTASDPDGDYLSFTIYYWNGSNWVELTSGWHSTFIVWYIGEVPGGSFYKIRVIASDGMYTAEDESNAAFTIDNPPPLSVRITTPDGGRRLSGTVNIHWTMKRATGDPLTFTVYYWDGSSWVELASGLTDTNYEWDTTTVPDGSGYKIRVVVNDGTFTAEDETDASFTIDNAASTSTTSTTTPSTIPGFEAILVFLIFLSLGLTAILGKRFRAKK